MKNIQKKIYSLKQLTLQKFYKITVFISFIFVSTKQKKIEIF